MRADSLRQSDNISRLQERYTEAQRKVDIADAEEAALRAQLKAAEATVQKLKDEAARTKKLVAETRAVCANDVRKRDRQIEGLKKAVADAGRARGERRSAGITTIHVTGDVGGDESSLAASGGAASNAASTTSEDYDLRQETNGFLAQLAKDLGEENETLLSLIRKTNESLKGMSGWEKTESDAGASRDSHVVAPSANPEDLATDIENVLSHLRTMLTNPSFVPLEEVMVREQEIFRLRDGWEKMETRWQEAVHLIDSWRRRMAANGRPVDMEELKMGLRLSPVRIRNVDETSHNEPFKLSTLQEEEEEESSISLKQASPSPVESLHLVPAAGYEGTAPEYDDGQDALDDSDAESGIFEDDVDVDMDELQQSEPNVEILQQSADYVPEDSPSITLPPPPKITPLEETSLASNRKPAGMITEKSRKRSGEFIDDSLDDTSEAPPPPPHRTKPGQSPQKRLKVSSDGENEEPKPRPRSEVFDKSDSSLDSILLKPSSEPAPSKASSKPTAKPHRSEVASKKGTPAPARPVPAVRTVRAVGQERKDTPPKILPRTRATRAAAATASSSSRAGTSKPEPSKPRPAPASASTADMPPPPRPTRNKNASPANPPAPTTRAEKPSPAEEELPPLGADASATAAVQTPSASSGSKRGRDRVPESPARSPTKSASRLPRAPRPLPQPPQQSPITVAGIAAKLAASEREANAARVRAKLKAARLGGGGGGAIRNPTESSAATNTTTAAANGTSGTRAVSGDSAAASSASDGDPVKRDRDTSGGSSSSAELLAPAVGTRARPGAGPRTTTTESSRDASLSLDENGTAGGVSILGAEASSSSAASSVVGAAEQEASAPNPALAPTTAAAAAAPSSSSSPQRKRPKTTSSSAAETATPGRRTRTTAAAAAAAAVAAAATSAEGPAGATTSPAKNEGVRRKREVRSRAEKAASRRRSTLSPWELQSLIAGDVVPPASPGAAAAGGQ